MAFAWKRWRSFLIAAPLAWLPQAETLIAIAVRAPLLLLVTPKLWAKVFSTQEAVLQKAFPSPVEVRRKTLFLTPEQVRDIERVARAKMTSPIVTYYQGWKNGKCVGTALFDTNIVRTMPMTYMALVKPDGTLGYVEVLSFYEPEDYLPRAGWLRLFNGKALDDKLRLRWGIPNVAGASLTCQVMTDGVRRLLATYQVIPKGGDA
jgi:hypothetical protein